MPNSNKKERSIEIEILGKTWRAYLVSSKKVQKIMGDGEANTEAVTVASDREIYFAKSDFCWRVVVHELVHAYLDILGASSAAGHLNVEAYEEQVCELFAKYQAELLWNSAEVFREFRNVVDGDEELQCLKETMREILSWE